MKAIHGGKATTDQIDARKVWVLAIHAMSLLLSSQRARSTM